MSKKDDREQRESLTQVFFIKDGTPTMTDVLQHLRLLLLTAYATEYHQTPGRWAQACEVLGVCVSLVAFKKVLSEELRPAGWNAICAELHGLDFSLTPAELQRSLAFLLATRCGAERSADEPGWAGLVRAAGAITTPMTLADFFKTQPALPGMQRVCAYLPMCRDIVVG